MCALVTGVQTCALPIFAHYVDLAEGVSMREVVDEATGISSKVVTDWKQQPKGADLRPRITLRNKKGDVIKLPNGIEARYFMSVDAILSVENGRSEEHTSELQSLMSISYAVFCLKKKKPESITIYQISQT